LLVTAAAATETRKGDWIQVGRSRKFYPFDPRPEEVFIEDVSLSLSRIARYTGHTRADEDALSVAQHSVLVSVHVEEQLGQMRCSRSVISGACSQRSPTHLVEPPSASRTLWSDSALVEAQRHPVMLVCETCAAGFSVRDAVLSFLTVRRLTPALRRELLLWALLHDAAEAYISDLPRPIKHMPELAAYRAAEKRIQAAICQRFGLPVEEPPIVKAADTILLTTEARDLMAPLHPEWTHKPENGFAIRTEEIFPVGWRAARHMFMKRFTDLMETT
jgi:hypothetical protein